MNERLCIKAILLIITFIFCVACTHASSNKRIYKPAQIKQVNMWLVEFSYEPGEKETTLKGDESELKIKQKGQYSRDLQLRDDIHFTLQDDYSIPVTKVASENVGKIQIHPIHDYWWDGFKSLTVILVGNKGDTLARLKIENGDKRPTFLRDSEFARYSAEAIAEVIKGK